MRNEEKGRGRKRKGGGREEGWRDHVISLVIM